MSVPTDAICVPEEKGIISGSFDSDQTNDIFENKMVQDVIQDVIRDAIRDVKKTMVQTNMENGIRPLFENEDHALANIQIRQMINSAMLRTLQMQASTISKQQATFVEVTEGSTKVSTQKDATPITAAAVATEVQPSVAEMANNAEGHEADEFEMVETATETPISTPTPTMTRKVAAASATKLATVDMENLTSEEAMYEVTVVETVPLSKAKPDDKVVHNDILKMVLVGDNAVENSNLGATLKRESSKRLRSKRFDVHKEEWRPIKDGIEFDTWEIQTPIKEKNDPTTQSLFFSSHSLYLLAYDLGAIDNEKFCQLNEIIDVDSDDESWDESEDMSQCNKGEDDWITDRALMTHIKEGVLSWVDCISRRVTQSIILPIGLVPSDMQPEIAQQRCRVMQTQLSKFVEKNQEQNPWNTIRLKFSEDQSVACVSLHNDMGIDNLQRMILEVVDSNIHGYFRIGEIPPPGTVEMMKLCEDLQKKEEKQAISVDDLIARLPNQAEFGTKDLVVEILKFLDSIGRVLYFGEYDLSSEDYVILDHGWLVHSIYCILRTSGHKELSQGAQLLLGNHVTKSFCGENSRCPILSSHDMRNSLQKGGSNILEKVTTDTAIFRFFRHLLEGYGVLLPLETADPTDRVYFVSSLLRRISPWLVATIFRFLRHLLEYYGVLMPLEIADPTDRVYFVPSLLRRISQRTWTFSSTEAWRVTLCNSWHFKDGAPSNLMNRVTVALLRDLYQNCTISHDGKPMKIHQIRCWKDSLILGIEREGIINKIFVAIMDHTSSHRVATGEMRYKPKSQRLVVSGNGAEGHHGQPLWRGGYDIVLKSIEAILEKDTSAIRQIICPECLERGRRCTAATLNWDEVLKNTEGIVWCTNDHKVPRHLISGTTPAKSDFYESKLWSLDSTEVKRCLPSVVLVGSWDDNKKQINTIGSGFIADEKRGLIVTASHILFDMESISGFGKPFSESGRAIVGVLPNNDSTTAVFRYFAEVVAADVHNSDVCILKLKSRLEYDVDVHKLALVKGQDEISIENFEEESLSSLKVTKDHKIMQAIGIIGFNQDGEGRTHIQNGEGSTPQRHVNDTLELVTGYIRKESRKSSFGQGAYFSPTRKEITVMCSTVVGHSGGPCLNAKGKVVGIVSRGDHIDRQRSYLVPSIEIKRLIRKVKKKTAQDLWMCRPCP